MKHLTASAGEEKNYPDYSKRIIFQPEDFKDGRHLLQTVTIPAQTKQRKHRHHKQTEVFYILEGECAIFVNDKEYVSRPGDAFICEPGDTHYLWNRSDREFKLVVFKIDFDAQADDIEWENL